MALGGKRIGAGRKPNAINRISKEFKQEALDKYPDFNPLVELIDFYHTTDDQKHKLEALKEILKKYVPDLKAIDHSSSDGTALLAPLIIRASEITPE